ncbi:MAG: group II intron reverse transcriptase domain-containing protein [Rhodobacteraceae bacterium]|nr:group II intron reverse transcriptase domain-containing protein [Paracoccaceae bacterium]
MDLIEAICDKDNFHQAWQWLHSRRKNSHYNNDYWYILFHRQAIEKSVVNALRTGIYRFSPCKYVNGVGCWGGQDALVLRAITQVLTPHLMPHISEHCYHVAGRGGAKACVSAVDAAVADYKFVCRSDVNSYYASVNHRILMRQLSKLIPERALLELIAQLLDRLDEVDGELYHVEGGITKGSPLSPLLGAVYLQGLDRTLGDYCQQRQLKYMRFMDDWIVLCHTRNQLRTVVRLMNGELDKVRMTKHPFKTYIGRIKDQGFDFLGYRIADKKVNGLAVAWSTWVKYHTKLKQLYEQNVPKQAIAEYVRRWIIWAKSGVTLDLNQPIKGHFDSQIA